MAAAKTSDELDYATWAPATKTALKAKGLWDVVENGVPPDPSKIPELSATIQAEELSKWRDLVVKDTKALQFLQSSLPNSAFRMTLSASSAKDVWDLLQKGNQVGELVRVEKQFEELVMEEGEMIKFYLGRVRGILEQMRRLNSKKSKYELNKKVLSSLSRPYNIVASMMLEDVELMEKMTLGDLVEFFELYDSVAEEAFLLMLKDMSLRYCDVCNKSDHHNQEECYSSGAWQVFRSECFQCGELGHYASDCKRKNQQQPVDTEAQEEEIEVDYLMLVDEALGKFTYDEDMWMIYANGTTNHMTPHEKYFTVLDKTHKAIVGLAEGKLLSVEGRGDVKIMMKEGKKKTIKNVLFVPGLNRNVLSLDQMIARGYSTTTKQDKCIFHDRTGAVFGDTVWDERGPALRLNVVERKQESAGTEAQVDKEEEIVVDYVMAAVITESDLTYDEDTWMVSGFSTIHMTPYEKVFTTLDRTQKGKVGLKDGTVLMAEGKGDVEIVMKKGKKKKTISNVLFVPGMMRNVLSLSQMEFYGCSFREGRGGECIISDETGAVYGETTWDGKGLALRLQVVKRN